MLGRLFFRASAIAGWIVSGSCALLYIEYALAYSAITLLQSLWRFFSARAQRPVPVPLTPAPLRKGSRSVLRFYPMFFATLPACPSEPALRHIAIEASRSASSRSSCLGLGPGLGLGLGSRVKGARSSCAGKGSRVGALGKAVARTAAYLAPELRRAALGPSGQP